MYDAAVLNRLTTLLSCLQKEHSRPGKPLMRSPKEMANLLMPVFVRVIDECSHAEVRDPIAVSYAARDAIELVKCQACGTYTVPGGCCAVSSD